MSQVYGPEVLTKHPDPSRLLGVTLDLIYASYVQSDVRIFDAKRDEVRARRLTSAVDAINVGSMSDLEACMQPPWTAKRFIGHIASAASTQILRAKTNHHQAFRDMPGFVRDVLLLTDCIAIATPHERNLLGFWLSVVASKVIGRDLTPEEAHRLEMHSSNSVFAPRRYLPSSKLRPLLEALHETHAEWPGTEQRKVKFAKANMSKLLGEGGRPLSVRELMSVYPGTQYSQVTYLKARAIAMAADLLSASELQAASDNKPKGAQLHIRTNHWAGRK